MKFKQRATKHAKSVTCNIDSNTSFGDVLRMAFFENNDISPIGCSDTPSVLQRNIQLLRQQQLQLQLQERQLQLQLQQQLQQQQHQQIQQQQHTQQQIAEILPQQLAIDDLSQLQDNQQEQSQYDDDLINDDDYEEDENDQGVNGFGDYAEEEPEQGDIDDFEDDFDDEDDDEDYDDDYSSDDRIFATTSSASKRKVAVPRSSAPRRQHNTPKTKRTKHVEFSDDVRDESIRNGGYLCDEEGCGKSFPSLRKLRHHKVVHSDEFPFVCAYKGCGKRFKRKFGIDLHSTTHFDLDPEMYSKTSNNSSFFGRRMQYSSCKPCGQKFKTVHEYQFHMLNHGKEPFKCPVRGCARTFSIWKSFQKHRASHYFNYYCKMGGSKCDHQTSNLQLLKLHIYCCHFKRKLPNIGGNTNNNNNSNNINNTKNIKEEDHIEEEEEDFEDELEDEEEI